MTRSRITHYGTANAADLTAHPLNWRDHPQAQREALNQALGALGWIKPVIVNSTTGRLLDGHLRVEQAAARGESVPVVWVDLTEREEALILATLDPIAAEAGTDTEGLAALLGQLQAEYAILNSLLSQVADQAGIALDKDGSKKEAGPAAPVCCPRCGTAI